MNRVVNSQLRPLNLSLLLVVSSVFAAPLAAQQDADDRREEQSAAQGEAPEMTEEAERAIDRGLQFLLASQNTDGSWSSENGDYAIAGTSLGLMAFMVKGHFPGFGRYGEALDRAKGYLLKRNKDSPTGAMGVKMYEIGLFTIDLAVLWGMASVQ